MPMILAKKGKPLRFSSAPTRYASLHMFTGGAQGDEEMECPQALPIDGEDFETKFNSSVNRIDSPKNWGPMRGGGKFGPVRLTNADAIATIWRKFS